MKGCAIKYSDEELKWVSDNRTLVISELHKQFCEKFGRDDVSADTLKALKTRNGWKTGRTGCFEKGNIPHPDARCKGPNKTSFKAGNQPKNWKPCGSSRINKDGYIEVKVQEPKTWKLLHLVIWEAVNGELPKGHCVIFKDGDKTNVRLSNLELISRNANLQINRFGDVPEELRETVRAVGKLKAKTIELEAR